VPGAGHSVVTTTCRYKPASYCISGRRSPPPATSHTSWPAATQKRRYVRLRGNRRGMAGDGAPDMASLAGDTGECVYSTYVYTPAGVKLILKRVRKLLAILDIGSNPPKLLDDHLLYRRRYDRLRVSSANNLPLKKNCGNKLGTLMHQNKCQIICHLKILQNNSARRRYGRLRCTGGVAGNGYSA